MFSRRKMIWGIAGLLLVAGLFLLSGCSGAPAQMTEEVRGTDIPESESVGPIMSAPSDASTPITVQLILSKIPELNETVELTFVIQSIEDAPGTKATILLPEGAELIEGELDWEGDLIAGIPHELQARIQFTSVGNKTIEAKALSQLENGDIWGDAAYLYLSFTEEGGMVGFPVDEPAGSDPNAPTPESVEPQP